jgi:hypothetical protein
MPRTGGTCSRQASRRCPPDANGNLFNGSWVVATGNLKDALTP